MRVAVNTADGESNPRGLQRISKSLCKLLLDTLKGDMLAKGEIEIFREAIVGDEAFLYSGTPLEGQRVSKERSGQANQKPR